MSYLGREARSFLSTYYNLVSLTVVLVHLVSQYVITLLKLLLNQFLDSVIHNLPLSY